MPSWLWATLRKTSGVFSAGSGSKVIILQRGSRSRTETTTLDPIRTLRPTSEFSEKPFAPARSRYTFARKRRLSRAVPTSSPSCLAVCGENSEIGRQLRAAAGQDHALTLLHSDRAMTDCRPISLFSLQTAKQRGDEVGTALDRR